MHILFTDMALPVISAITPNSHKWANQSFCIQWGNDVAKMCKAPKKYNIYAKVCRVWPWYVFIHHLIYLFLNASTPSSDPDWCVWSDIIVSF